MQPEGSLPCSHEPAPDNVQHFVDAFVVRSC